MCLCFFIVIFLLFFSSLFFFKATSTTLFYPLSLHDALPISSIKPSIETLVMRWHTQDWRMPIQCFPPLAVTNRKSTRLNSSHTVISYAVFCLKKKKKNNLKRHLQINHKKINY